ncbi:MAG TPA: YfiR family protein [Burkholderiales bacterium]|nr:YfiR family protein [Burkholderiales bacterium]
MAIAILWPGWSASATEEAPALEHRVKAAFLYQFAGYVEWPPNSFERADTPVTIAVVGAEPLAAELGQMTVGRTVGGRRVSVRQVKAEDSLAGVHILFIGRAESARLSQLARTAQPRSILTVTESDGALEQGGMINFVIVDRRVRFEVALDTVEKGGLRLSSRLLAVAEQVRKEAP